MTSQLTIPDPPPACSPTNSPWKDPRTGLFYLAVVSIALLVLPPLAAVLVRLWHSLQASLAARRAARQTDETSPLLAGDDAAENDADDDVVLVPPPRAESRVLPAGSGSLTGDLRLHVASVGGWVPFGLNLVRLLASLALVGLTLWAIVIDAEDSTAPVGKAPAAGGGELVSALGKGHKHGGGRKGRKGERRREAFGREEWVEIGQCFFFVRLLRAGGKAALPSGRVARTPGTDAPRLLTHARLRQIYCATLSLVTLVLPRFRLAKTHLSLLLLSAFLLSAYRNLLPLALGRAPLDIVLHHLKGIHDPLWDTLVWLRVGLLALAGVAVPLTLLLLCPSCSLLSLADQPRPFGADRLPRSLAPLHSAPANRETLRHDPLAFFRRRDEPAADADQLE